MSIITPNPENLEDIKAKIKTGGYQNLHILADFDHTLTYGKLNGKNAPAIISLLREENYLSEEYSKKAHALYDKYHNAETDLDIPTEERKIAMQEWWDEHFKLLIETGLNKNDLEKITKEGVIKLRTGVADFLDLLHQNNIPLIVISASGCGDAIPMFFKNIGKDYPNIFYVINKFNWDKNGKAISIQPPIIHSLNKEETILSEIPEIHTAIQNRKNVILLGNNIGDIDMITGFEYENLLKIGFYNDNDDKFLPKYKENFDLILTEDMDFDPINELIKKLQ